MLQCSAVSLLGWCSHADGVPYLPFSLKCACARRQESPYQGSFTLDYWCAPPGSSALRLGCTDPAASNYEPTATFHTSCRYARTPRPQAGLDPAQQKAGAAQQQKGAAVGRRRTQAEGHPVLSSSDPQACPLTNGSACATSRNYPRQHYRDNDQCTLTVASGAVSPVAIGSVGQFVTEAGRDYLTIAGVKYSGTAGPRGVALQNGDTVEWDPLIGDGIGWKLCLSWSESCTLPGGAGAGKWPSRGSWRAAGCCAEGTGWDGVDGSGCAQCVGGQYTENAMCTLCPSGKYSAATGAIKCSLCSPGRVASAGALSCVDEKVSSRPGSKFQTTAETRAQGARLQI